MYTQYIYIYICAGTRRLPLPPLSWYPRPPPPLVVVVWSWMMRRGSGIGIITESMNGQENCILAENMKPR